MQAIRNVDRAGRRFSRRSLLAGGAAASIAAVAPAVVRAQSAPKRISYGLTSKTSNDWVNFVAQKRGFFESNGVAPDFIVVGSAAANGQQLAAGSLDLAGIASPNLIQAVVAGAPLLGVLDRTRVSPYLICGRAGYTSIKQLAGKTVIVDAPSGITRLMVDGVLEANGMKSGDVTYTYAGGTPERFAALASGTVDAAMLLPPFSFRAIGQGFSVLAEIPKYFPSLPVDLIAANQPWTRAQTDVLGGYLRAYLQGVRWLYDPANEAAATQILIDATSTSPGDAKKTYDVYVGQKVLSADGLTPLPALDKMVAMLVKLGQVPAPALPAARFVTNEFVDRAAAQLKRPG